jgi:hypothetical protein
LGKVKGTAIGGRLDYARRRGGNEALQRVVSAIRDPETRDLLADGRALKSAWYPFEALVDVSVEIDRIWGKGDLAILDEVGGDVAEADLSSVYKIFFKVANPHYIIDKAANVWRSYYSSGECVVVQRTEKVCAMEIRDFDQPHRAHCLAVMGWMKRTLKLAGCKDVEGSHPQCRTQGGQTCLFRGSWS